MLLTVSIRVSPFDTEDADDEREMSKAASVIQGKFRERLQRRSMADITNNGNDSGKYQFYL